MSAVETVYTPNADDVETSNQFSLLNRRSLELRRPLYKELAKTLAEFNIKATFHRFLILGLASGKEAVLVHEYLADSQATITGVDMFNDIDPVLENEYPETHCKIVDGQNQKVSVLDFLRTCTPSLYDFVLVSTGRRHGLFSTAETQLLALSVENGGLVVTVGDSAISKDIMERQFIFQFSTQFEENSMFEVWKRN